MEYGVEEPSALGPGGSISKIRRIGLTRDPPGGWPLDHVFVGVATLRILRELYRQENAQRPWDLHLRTGVSPQGSADALRRLGRIGLVDVLHSRVPGRADAFRLASSHYILRPLAGLFAAEDAAARDTIRALMNRVAAPLDGPHGRAGSGPPARGTAPDGSRG